MFTRNRAIASAILIAFSLSSIGAVAQNAGGGTTAAGAAGTNPVVSPPAGTPSSEPGVPRQGAVRPSADVTTGMAPRERPVPARPCSTAARETDGTTTCIGLPPR
jgi:hypothetical protein